MIANITSRPETWATCWMSEPDASSRASPLPAAIPVSVPASVIAAWILSRIAPDAPAVTPAPKPPALASPLRIWNDSAPLDPESLEPARALVLHAPRRHGEELPAYVLLDDWLPLDERERVDRE